jgi:hypothetical protein
MTFEAGQLELPLGIQVSMASFDLAGHTFSFSGHETFVFRYTWLKKAVDAVRVDPRVFGQDNAIVTPWRREETTSYTFTD